VDFFDTTTVRPGAGNHRDRQRTDHAVTYTTSAGNERHCRRRDHRNLTRRGTDFVGSSGTVTEAVTAVRCFLSQTTKRAGTIGAYTTSGASGERPLVSGLISRLALPCLDRTCLS